MMCRVVSQLRHYHVQGYLDKAGKLGGKTLVPPVEIPTGTFAWFADPDGNTIGLWKPK
jgi:predicted enzyme related to lactoylglutathione lyase